ncbi:MAG: type VI secretion system protein TssA [Candidatus Zixiibacteriota bacterium]|nr:MAG: type VI secretion system protein TssA [candidate division Zixibacteria bacterium]
MDLRDLGKTPIPGNSPAGEDVSFDDSFEELKAEVAKLSSPQGSEAVNWSRVADLAQEILAEKSKHLAAAVYLAQALAVRRGMTGAALGCHILRDLLEQFWDSLYPPPEPPVNRYKILAWWCEKIVPQVARQPGRLLPEPERQAFLDDLHALQALLQARFPDPPPLHQLASQLKQLQAERPAAPPPGPPEPIAALRSAPRAEAPAPEKTDPQDLLKDGLDLLARACRAEQNRDPFSPLAFRLNRIVAWLPLRELPSHTDNRTLLASPEPAVIAALARLRQEANWAELLALAEAQVQEHRFWLDPSRYAAEASEEMGRPRVREAVEGETLDLLRRLPGLESMTFVDGVPFADPDTQAWIRRLRNPAVEEAPAPLPEGSTESAVADSVARALQMVKANKMAAALRELNTRRRLAASARERLLWDLGLCQVCARPKLQRLMAPYAREVLDLIEEYRLDRWDPDLAAQALAAVLTGLRKQPRAALEDGGRPLIEEVVDRLSLLDPSKVVDYPA